MKGTWIGLIVAAVMMNVFALVVTSHFYTAWSIRVRNDGYYFLLRREVSRERAERADEIAEDVVRWLRPLGFTVVNVLRVLLAIRALYFK
jgi:hypothetical protein